MDQDIKDLLTYKDSLVAAERAGILLQPRPANKSVGLQNSGATCYLNSVLQCMLQVPELITSLKEDRSNSAPISKELKDLFEHLMHSAQHSVDTVKLQAAFGWSGTQKHEQHDAHEFYSALINALGESSPAFEKSVESTFQGLFSDSYKCSSCGNCSTVKSTFRSLSVDVPDDRESADDSAFSRIPLASLLANLLVPETLDEDNKWECNGCKEKVCATRSQVFESLPPVLGVHLKRFRFDPIAKKRRKITVPVEVPKELNICAALGVAGSAYQLSGVIVHFGTAMGGHYKAYTKIAGCDEWLECDDAVVEKLSTDVVQQLFAAPPAAESDEQGKDEGTSAIVMFKQQVLAENAYILVYRRGDNISVDLPVSAAVQDENESFQRLLALAKTRKRLVQLTVKARNVNDAATTIATTEVMLPKDSTIQEATQVIYRAFVDAKSFDESVVSTQNCRLIRVAQRRGKWVGVETYGDRPTVSVHAAGLCEEGLAFLDLRSDTDAPFAEFSPNDMRLSVKVWDASRPDGGVKSVPGGAKLGEAGEEDGEGWMEVIVPGQDKATAAALRQKLSEVLKQDAASLAVMSFHSTCPVQWMEASSDQELAKHFSLRPGSTVVVELNAPASSGESVAFAHLFALKNKVKVFFNDPRQNVAKYDLEAVCTKEQVLSSVRQEIAQALGLDAADKSAFHLRRGDGQPQLKEEEKTVEELGITDGSVIHVQLGKGCGPGEHLVRFEIEVRAAVAPAAEEEAEDGKAANKTRYVVVDDIAILEKANVLAIKKQLFEAWGMLHEKVSAALAAAGGAALAAPQSPSHIRLRDLKGGKISGPLRDDRIVGRCLLGLADGRRVLVQILPNAETIGADDIMVTLRVASYDKKSLSGALDLCVPRACTVQELYARVATEQPQLMEAVEGEIAPEGLAEAASFELAKGFTTGPPLSLKNALKLKWNDSSFVGAPAAPVDKTLGLRDGSLLIARGKADWQRAQARVKARKEAADAELATQPVAAGAGASAVRARGKGESAKKLSTSSTEPALKICPPRPSSPNENVGDNSLGTGELPQPSPCH